MTARKSHELIVELAKKHNVLHGKWLLKVKSESASEVWPKIRSACIAGKLGSTAKISDQPENGTFVICAYSNNFNDREDVLRVRRAIHELGIYTKTALHYKPDAITLLDIYSGDMKGMRTTVYTCGGAATKDHAGGASPHRTHLLPPPRAARPPRTTQVAPRRAHLDLAFEHPW